MAGVCVMAGKFGRGVYGSRQWLATRKRVLDRDNWRCRTCGRPGVLEVHHFKTLAEGGAAFDMANLRALCRSCHFKAHRPVGVPGRAAWREAIHLGV